MERGRRANIPPTLFLPLLFFFFSQTDAFISIEHLYNPMKGVLAILMLAAALLAVSSASAYHQPQAAYHHSPPVYTGVAFPDTRHVHVYRHHVPNYFVQAPRGYPHVQHQRTYTYYQTTPATYHPAYHHRPSTRCSWSYTRQCWR